MNLYVLLAVVNFLLAAVALASMAARGPFGFKTHGGGMLPRAVKHAAAGSGSVKVATGDRRVHRSSWGARLFVFVLSALLLVVTPRLAAGGTLMPSDLGPGFAAVLALVVYANAFIWAYRIAIDRNAVSMMGLAFVMRDYPLSALARVDDKGLYTWWLTFSDGRRHLALKTVVGLPALRHRLANVLEANARG